MELTRSSVEAAMAKFQRIAASDVRGRSAVVVLVVPAAEPKHSAVVLTVRSERLRTHKGQWAFPGGRIDPGETARFAALRELHEEVGILVDADRIVGELDDFVTRSGYCITPVVVWAGDLPFEPTPNPAEVASVHAIELSDIDVEPTLTSIQQSKRPVIKLPLMGTFLYAPTAAMLYQFREVVLHGRTTRVANYEQPLFAWK